MTDLENAIFVIGCPCSGTTLLWDIIKSHPDVCYPPKEGQDLDGMPDSMRHFLGRETFMLWAINGNPYWLDEKNCIIQDKYQIINVYSQYVQQGKRFCDKSPAHTARARGIQAYFPDARFVGIVRDPYAVVPSIVARRTYDGRYPEMAGLETTFVQAANQWNLANTMLMSNEARLRLHIVRYEDLTASPEKIMDMVFQFLSLELDYRIPPIDQTCNERRITSLTLEDRRIIHNTCNVVARHFDYEAPRD